jgi:RNA polymerase sigma-70 factor (ECF subfamily)
MGLGVSEFEEPSVDEGAIIRRVVAGERDEFRHLVELYQARIYNLVMRQVGDSQAAREITQEAFLKAYLNLTKFRFEAKFSTWLTRIAINLTHTYFTSKAYKQRIKNVTYDARVHSGSEQIEQDDRYDESALERLRVAVTKLPPIYREVMVLCKFERKAYAEAAAILSIPEGTVRSRLNKAHNLLRTIYFAGK